MFSVSLLYENRGEGNDQESFWEESILLVDVLDEETANRIATQLAKSEDFQYVSANGAIIYKRFFGVQNVYEIDQNCPFVTGCEIFSRFLREDEAKSLMEPFED